MEVLKDERQACSLSLVLLDIMMPGMTGVELMERMGRSVSCPVLAMTGSVDPDTVARMRYECFVVVIFAFFILNYVNHQMCWNSWRYQQTLYQA